MRPELISSHRQAVLGLADPPGGVQSRRPQPGCGVGGEAEPWAANERCGRFTLVLSVAQQRSQEAEKCHKTPGRVVGVQAQAAAP